MNHFRITDNSLVERFLRHIAATERRTGRRGWQSIRGIRLL